MSATDTFRSKAPWIIGKLMADFQFSIEDAAAIAGNAGHESMGFTALQELKPTVKGSAGGYGWFQWTGPRRRAYIAWCDANKLTPSSDDANYGFLAHELRTSEAKAVGATKSAKTLEDKVIAFEKTFERAGVKHYPSRQRWAIIALDAYRSRATEKPVQAETPAPVPDVPKVDIPAPRPSLSIGQVMAWLAALIAAVVAWLIAKGGI